MRRYVAPHDEWLSAVFSRDGRIRYIETADEFPMISCWKGDPLPTAGKNETTLTNVKEVDTAIWLVRPERHTLCARTLYQENGFAITLLVAEYIH